QWRHISHLRQPEQRHQQVPVVLAVQVLMTGYAESATRANGFLDTGMEMITKPFTLESMASRIRRMVTMAG
ncbi:hypothetical protein, partial [Caballeronia sp. M23-90]